MQICKPDRRFDRRSIIMKAGRGASIKQAQISHELSRYTPPSHKYLSLNAHLSAIHRRPEIDPFVIQR